MEIRETIRIEGTPFPKPLPVPVDLLRRTLSEHGFLFEDRGSTRTIVLSGLYVPERLGQIQQIVESMKWSVRVTRSLWPAFDNKDYERSPLWVINFTDIWVDEVDFALTCNECGRKRVEVDTSIRVSEVKSNKPLHSVNGQVKIVSADVRLAIAGSLVGARFYPFDYQERYFYLCADRDLGPLIIRGEEVIGYAGDCPRCKVPRFNTYFGPLRFARACWHGDDIVHESLHNGCLFTPKAFDLLRTFDRSLSRGGVVFLE